MVDDLRLTHPHGLRHPVQEGEVSPEVEIHKLAHKVPRPPWTCPLPIDVPFGKVNPVIDGLDSEQSKGQKECKSSQYVNQC